MKEWWQKWRPGTSSFEGRAFWIGFRSFMDLSGRNTRKARTELHEDIALEREARRREFNDSGRRYSLNDLIASLDDPELNKIIADLDYPE